MGLGLSDCGVQLMIQYPVKCSDEAFPEVLISFTLQGVNVFMDTKGR
jgi:hypothetical protein